MCNASAELHTDRLIVPHACNVLIFCADMQRGYVRILRAVVCRKGFCVMYRSCSMYMCQNLLKGTTSGQCKHMGTRQNAHETANSHNRRLLHHLKILCIPYLLANPASIMMTSGGLQRVQRSGNLAKEEGRPKFITIKLTRYSMMPKNTECCGLTRSKCNRICEKGPLWGNVNIRV